MVETIWTKLAAPHAGIEPSLRNSSQERNFLLQRPGGEMGSFASIAGTETALTREFGRHAFENAALLRVPHTLYNYRVWVVGAGKLWPNRRGAASARGVGRAQQEHAGWVVLALFHQPPPERESYGCGDGRDS